MSHTEFKNTHSVTAFLVMVALTALASFGCTAAGTNTTTTNMNSNANAANANANTNAVAAGGTTLEAREPERYSLTTTITVQPTGNAPQANARLAAGTPAGSLQGGCRCAQAAVPGWLPDGRRESL